MKVNSWRGGRGRSRTRYYLYLESMSLVRWNDGSHEWILDDFLHKSLNRHISWVVRGANAFSTKRSAERAIRKFPNYTVELSKHYRRRAKAWVYPKIPGSMPSEVQKSQDSFVGSMIAFKSRVYLYRFSDSGNPEAFDEAIVEGTLGIVTDTMIDGLISKVLVNGLMGWVESRYLFLIES